MSSGVELIAVFGAGVASAASPCVALLIPAYVGMVSTSRRSLSTGIASAEVVASSSSRSWLVPDTIVFVLGFSIVFSALGAVAGLAGTWVDASRSMLERVGGAALVALGVLAAMSSSSRGPIWLMGHWKPLGGRPSSTPAGMLRPFVIGVAFGAAWTPCVGPLLASALLAAGQRSSVVGGAAALFVYALGVGVPFLLISASAALLPNRPIRWVAAGALVHRLSAPVLVVLGVLLISGHADWLSSRSAQLIDAVT